MALAVWNKSDGKFEVTAVISRQILLKIILGIIILGIGVLAVLRFGVLPYYDARVNAVLQSGPYSVGDAARQFHHDAFVADLHADPLLWKRDLRQRQTRGQVDLVRLREGGVDLQVFGVVTQVPQKRNTFAYDGNTDKLPILFIASMRSPASWFSPLQRALSQARELRSLASDSELVLVLTREDLRKPGLKGLLSLEGMNEVPRGEATLERLAAAGYRMIGLTHFFDNPVAGSAYGLQKYGLTELGRKLMPRMEALGITVDLAHVSPAAFDEVLAMARKPVVVSHGGVAGTCPGPRNLTDDQLRAVARNGGVVGIGYWKTAICDVSLDGIVRAIRHTIDIAGIDHVGLGSDFDGNVTTLFDTAGLPLLTEALLASGLSEAAVRKVIGANVRRVLLGNLPR